MVKNHVSFYLAAAIVLCTSSCLKREKNVAFYKEEVIRQKRLRITDCATLQEAFPSKEWGNRSRRHSYEVKLSTPSGEDTHWGFRYVKYDHNNSDPMRPPMATFTELCAEGLDGKNVLLTKCGAMVLCPECSCEPRFKEPYDCVEHNAESFYRYKSIDRDELILEDAPGGERNYTARIFLDQLTDLVDDCQEYLPINDSINLSFFKFHQRVAGGQTFNIGLSGLNNIHYFKTSDGTLYGINFNFPLFANPVFQINADYTKYHYINIFYGTIENGWDNAPPDELPPAISMLERCRRSWTLDCNFLESAEKDELCGSGILLACPPSERGPSSVRSSMKSIWQKLYQMVMGWF